MGIHIILYESVEEVAWLTFRVNNTGSDNKNKVIKKVKIKKLSEFKQLRVTET